jgi:hypothetical protein
MSAFSTGFDTVKLHRPALQPAGAANPYVGAKAERSAAQRVGPGNKWPKLQAGGD